MTINENREIINPVMKDITETTKTYGADFAGFIHSHLTPKKKLVCDMCGTAGTPATEKEGANEVWNWGNEYDHGTICDECQETVNDSR